jgi:hypothetical protein
MPNTHVTGWSISLARVEKDFTLVTATVQGSVFCMARPEHRTEIEGHVTAPG